MTHFIGRYAVISGVLFLILCPNFCLGLCALEHGGKRPRLLCTEDSATVDSLPQEESLPEGEKAAWLDGYVMPTTVEASKFYTDRVVPAASEVFNLASAGVAVASARAEAGVTAGAEFLERAGLDGYLMPITMGVATTVVATPVAAAVLGAAGFTAGGVAAGSAAAAAQSTFYGGATGGIFAVAQSAGAAGISSLTVGVTGATATVTTAVLQKIPVSYVTETEVYTTAKSTAAAGLSTAKRFVSKVATEAGTEISQKAPEMVTAALRSLSLWQ
jgi:hypothetical protein